jgi:hypothetical protein
MGAFHDTTDRKIAILPVVLAGVPWRKALPTWSRRPAQFIQAEIEKWTKVTRQANISMN